MITKDINMEFDGIFHRLDLCVGGKVSILQKEINRLQRVINDIEDIVITFQECLKRTRSDSYSQQETLLMDDYP